jgi:hypothetical protein
MSEHTKGPWRVITPEERGVIFGDKDTSGFGLTIIADDDDDSPWIIADVADGQPGEGGPDASLLSAAPDLLEACKALLVMMDRGDQPRKFDEMLSWRQNDEKAQSMARAAIKKAKGEE